MTHLAIAFAAILILALVPSILPTWRSTLIAAGVMYGLIGVAFVWEFLQFGTTPTDSCAEESTGFDRFIFLSGILTTVLVGSCLFKAALSYVLSLFQPVTASRLRRILVGTSLFATALAYAALGFMGDWGLAVFVSIPFLWLALVTWLMPKGERK